MCLWSQSYHEAIIQIRYSDFRARKYTDSKYPCQLYHCTTPITANFVLHSTFRLEVISSWNDITDKRSQMLHLGDNYRTPFLLGSTVRSLTHHCFQSKSSVWPHLILTASLQDSSSFSKASHSNSIFGLLKYVSLQIEYPQLTLSIYKLGA